MKIKHSSKFPFKPYKGICLLPYIFLRKDLILEGRYEIVLNHEKIHYQQQKELFLVGFYILYAYFYLLLFFKYWNLSIAYKYNPFEREAFANENYSNYLLERPKNNWKGYK